MPQASRRLKTRWGSVAFFLAIHAVAIGGIPWYVKTFGLPGWELTLFAFYSFATVLSITVGYHRLFAHAAFKAHPLVRFLILFLGASSFQQSALRWSSQHRTHHQFVDTDQDPYNIKAGFFYAHIGWILFWKHAVNYENVKDLEKDLLVMHQHRHFQKWALGAGILVPILIWAALGRVWGGLVLGVASRLAVAFHAAFFINSFAHTFGTADYDFHSSARDHWLGALLTNGEGYHNFHHRFPSDYRNGFRWYHWDPSKWVIWTLSRVGLVWDLKRTPPSRILEARLQVEKKRAASRAG